MKPLRAILAVALFWLAAVTGAQALTLPAGLQLEPPEALDLTYQTIPSYDEKEKVVAGWAGDRLQYFVAVSRLPAGYTDAQAYHAGMARDLRADWGSLETGRSQTYQATNGLTGSAVTYTKRSTDPDHPSTTVLVHFLTDGRVSFLATVSAMPSADPRRVFEDALSLMRTAALSKGANAGDKPVRSEDEFVGTWTIEDKLPDGRKMVARIELKADLSFATLVRAGEQTVLAATGVWRRSAQRLHWTYLYSNPVLPADRREDIDSVVAADTNIIILRSSASGKERVLRRVAGAGK